MDNRAGTAEIWIASDGQRSNWLPEDPRWKSVIARLGGLSQRVRIRLLELDQAPEANASIAIREVARRPRGEKAELQVVLDIQRNRAAPAKIPVVMILDGERSETEIALEGQTTRWRRAIDLGSRRQGGWGGFSLPADANARDNTAWFVYGADTPLRAAVVSGDRETARDLRLAAASHNAEPARLIAAADIANAKLDDCSLLIWQAPLPEGAEADRLQSFAAGGGVVIFFPPGQTDPRQFAGMGWGDPQTAESQEGFRIPRWDEEEGPLAKSDEHTSLPLAANHLRPPPDHYRAKKRAGGLRGRRGFSGSPKRRTGRGLFLRVAPASGLVEPGRRPGAGAVAATPAGGGRPPLAADLLRRLRRIGRG